MTSSNGDAEVTVGCTSGSGREVLQRQHDRIDPVPLEIVHADGFRTELHGCHRHGPLVWTAVLQRYRNDDVSADLEVHLERAQLETIVQRRIGLPWELWCPATAPRSEEVRARPSVAVGDDEPSWCAPIARHGSLRRAVLGHDKNEQCGNEANASGRLLVLTVLVRRKLWYPHDPAARSDALRFR